MSFGNTRKFSSSDEPAPLFLGKRREFIARLLALGLVSTPSPSTGLTPSTSQRGPLLKPPRLRFGDTIGIVTPAGAMEPDALQATVVKVEALGFRTRLGAHVGEGRGHKAGTATQRVADLHTMFANPEVRAIWTVRGGYGASSLLPLLDYALIRRNPKILIGYSDITALHLGLLKHAGLVSFHGPVTWSSFSPFSLEHLLAVIMEPRNQYTLPLAAENIERGLSDPLFRARTLQVGAAEGHLLGGNLSVLCALLGTPHMPPLKNALLFLEDIDETPARVDRMLTQLGQTPGFDRVAGAVCGIFKGCIPSSPDPSQTLEEVLDDHFGNGRRPAAYGFSFGHIGHQVTLPVGIRARLETETRTLTLLESAVT